VIVYRTAQWHPRLVTHVFSVCTPYMPTTDKYVPTEELVNGPVPQFGYQLQLAGPEVEANLQTRERIKQFFKGMYGGKDDSGRALFKPQNGLDFDVIDKVGMPPLLNQEVSSAVESREMTMAMNSRRRFRNSNTILPNTRGMAYMDPVSVQSPVPFSATTLTTIIVNWYRTRKANFEDERK